MPYPDESSADPVLILVKHPEASSLEYPTKRPGEPVMFGPNITGSFNGQQNCSAPADWDIEVSGAFVDDKPFIGVINAGAGTQGYGFSFDASKSNQIYGETLTVQPPALRCLACIKV